MGPRNPHAEVKAGTDRGLCLQLEASKLDAGGMSNNQRRAQGCPRLPGAIYRPGVSVEPYYYYYSASGHRVLPKFRPHDRRAE